MQYTGRDLMPLIHDATRIKQKRGQGTGSKYKPWIKANEISSKGTSSTFADYIHGREIQALSQGELYYYYDLRWQDDVKDIREQFPLNLNETMQLAVTFNMTHPSKNNKPVTMTTDLLVTKSDGSLEAYSVKSSKADLSDRRTNEKLVIEQNYWINRKIPFKIVFKSDINVIKIQNIMDVVRYYYVSEIQTKEDVVRHLIATKQLKVDITKDYIDYKKIIYELEQKGGIFDEYLT